MIASIRQALQDIYPAGEANAIARLILAECFSISPIDIYMGRDIRLSPDDETRLAQIIDRLRHHEPVQYIIGYTHFCGLRFQVNSQVLIPRPETAELIELILQSHPTPPLRILDIGTGSGCIPITLSHHWPQSTVESWDISPEALQTAEANNRSLHTSVRFRLCDILQPSADALSPAEKPFQLIVSNPPYIKEREKELMEHNVLDWEPHLALFVPDDDPLLFYRTITTRAAQGLLAPQGWLYFEVNRDHAHDTAQLLTQQGFSRVEVIQDLSGNNRIVRGQQV